MQILWRLYREADQQLQGMPDAVLTIALVLCALVALFIAVRGNAVLKAAAVAWFILP